LQAKPLLLAVGSVPSLGFVDVEAVHAVLAGVGPVRCEAWVCAGSAHSNAGATSVRQPGQGTAAPFGEGATFRAKALS
jgi:hypothetical protein